jgi:23S rRNA (pseudouridine1915-N3)-methyltransferase
MKLILGAVGRLGKTVENTLTQDYLSRATATGRAMALGPCELLEIEAKKAKGLGGPQLKAVEAEAITAALCGPSGTDMGLIITCDEHGELLTSRDLATRIERLRDRGERRVTFLIGGADGLDPSLLKASAFSLAFGPQTWPHALARVMLAEQMYRATTILANLPYHRD